MPEKRCLVCDRSESAQDPLIKEGYYPDTWFHASCYNSDATIRWRETRNQSDPAYKRYWELSTWGLPCQCSACGLTTYLWAKFTGHSPSWELCCTQCNHVDYEGVSPYKYRLERVLELSDSFKRGKPLSEMLPELLNIARGIELTNPPRPCECGGVFAILAQPRCPSCRSVVFDSFFHYSGEKPVPPDIQPATAESP
jgi:hypothetical protein